MAGPHFIGLEEAREVLAEMGVVLTPRQMKRAADKDADGRRKLPEVMHVTIEERRQILSGLSKRVPCEELPRDA